MTDQVFRLCVIIGLGIVIALMIGLALRLEQIRDLLEELYDAQHPNEDADQDLP